jgi:hypothetical protein
MMLMKKTAVHPHYERLKSIEEQILSGADLTKQLLASPGAASTRSGP